MELRGGFSGSLPRRTSLRPPGVVRPVVVLVPEDDPVPLAGDQVIQRGGGAVQAGEDPPGHHVAVLVAVDLVIDVFLVADGIGRAVRAVLPLHVHGAVSVGADAGDLEGARRCRGLSGRLCGGLGRVERPDGWRGVVLPRAVADGERAADGQNAQRERQNQTENPSAHDGAS